jgi:hypothetical protein
VINKEKIMIDFIGSQLLNNMIAYLQFKIANQTVHHIYETISNCLIARLNQKTLLIS